MAVVYVLMYFKCKICFTVYTGETKINDTYLLTYYAVDEWLAFENESQNCYLLEIPSEHGIVLHKNSK